MIDLFPFMCVVIVDYNSCFADPNLGKNLGPKLKMLSENIFYPFCQDPEMPKFPAHFRVLFLVSEASQV